LGVGGGGGSVWFVFVECFYMRRRSNFPTSNSHLILDRAKQQAVKDGPRNLP